MVWLGTRVIWLLYLVCPVNILGIWWVLPECFQCAYNNHTDNPASQIGLELSQKLFQEEYQTMMSDLEEYQALMSDQEHHNDTRAVGSPILMDPNHICKKSRRIGGKQRDICGNEPEIVREVALGTNVALTECAYQFRYRRWRCHTEKRGIQKVLKLDTREAAFVNAIISSGLMYSITEACSLGKLPFHCGCDTRRPRVKPNETWLWGGCNDDIRYSQRKTRNFMEIVPKSKRVDISLKLQLHNYEAGRLAIKRNMRRLCKCHGLSGSCSLSTCWIKMPKFSEVGEILKDKFNGATLVTISNNGENLINVAKHSDLGTLKPISVQDLVYTTESPDYCVSNKKMGSIGTKSRKCDPKSKGMDGCDLMCCGRGYKTYKVKTQENCNCRFEWCCEVICDTCDVIKTIHVCK